VPPPLIVDSPVYFSFVIPVGSFVIPIFFFVIPIVFFVVFFVASRFASVSAAVLLCAAWRYLCV
jgi:hypothetical protein